MQSLKNGSEFEFTTDASAVRLSIASSRAGRIAKVYVDGTECGVADTFSVNARMDYPTAWVQLPNDGKTHTVKYEVEDKSTKYVFTVCGVIEKWQ